MITNALITSFLLSAGRRTSPSLEILAGSSGPVSVASVGQGSRLSVALQTLADRVAAVPRHLAAQHVSAKVERSPVFAPLIVMLSTAWLRSIALAVPKAPAHDVQTLYLFQPTGREHQLQGAEAALILEGAEQSLVQVGTALPELLFGQ